jgi:hypothetical protein
MRRFVLVTAFFSAVPLLAQIGPHTAPAATAAVAPAASAGGESSSKPAGEGMEPVLVTPVRKTMAERCDSGEVSPRQCRFHWRDALVQSAEFLAIQHAGNIPTYEVKGKFFSNYHDALAGYRFSRWSDDDPFIVDYVGHPMMGAVTGFIEIQNDPRGADLEISRSGAYWKSRAKATAFMAAYIAQWELGPFSETSLGNIGKFNYYSKSAHHMTNGTGLVDLMMTPIGGTTIMLGEDLLDKYAIQRLEGVSRNRAYLLSISFLNPTRSFANLLRFKAPWYRDSRNTRPTVH